MAKKATKADPYMKEIGDRIVHFREKKGLSQIELARKMGADTNNTVRRIELGLTNPTINTLRNIAKILDVKLTDLIKD